MSFFRSCHTIRNDSVAILKYKTNIRQIQLTPTSCPFTGVIVFGSDQEVAELMKAVKRLNATGKFNWIGSDGWSARALVSEGELQTIYFFSQYMLCPFALNLATLDSVSRKLEVYNFLITRKLS